MPFTSSVNPIPAFVRRVEYRGGGGLGTCDIWNGKKIDTNSSTPPQNVVQNFQTVAQEDAMDRGRRLLVFPTGLWLGAAAS